MKGADRHSLIKWMIFGWLGWRKIMGRITILGTASAVSSGKHENTHLIIEEEGHYVLVDCPGNPIARLDQAKINPLDINDLIITHFHPDHVSGFSLFLMESWLMARKKSLNVYGNEFTITRLKKMMALFDWERWPDFFEVIFYIVPEKNLHSIIDNDVMLIQTSPGKHLIPTIGIRVQFKRHKKVVVYSSDTEFCDAIGELADGADCLIHEAAGPDEGHSSAEEAGMIAAKANVQKLYLIHYPIQNNFEWMQTQAKRHYSGQVIIAEDFMQIDVI